MVGSGTFLPPHKENALDITKIRVNCDGTRVALLARRRIQTSGAASAAAGVPSPALAAGGGGGGGKRERGGGGAAAQSEGDKKKAAALGLEPPSGASVGGPGASSAGAAAGSSAGKPIVLGETMLARLGIRGSPRGRRGGEGGGGSSSSSSSSAGGSGGGGGGGGGGAGAAAATLTVPDTCVYCYSVECDTTVASEFGPGRYPSEACWDCQEPSLLCVQTERSSAGGGGNGGGAAAAAAGAAARGPTGGGSPLFSSYYKGKGLLGEGDSDPDTEIVTFFSVNSGEASESSGGLLKADSFPLAPPHEGLLGLRVPYLLSLAPMLLPTGGSAISASASASAISGSATSPHPSSSKYSRFPRHSLRDFKGVEDAVGRDGAMRTALLAFSRNCARGAMDEAYRSIKACAGLNAIWGNMVGACVGGRRLDVAAVALGHIGDARTAKALREARSSSAAEGASSGGGGEGGAAPAPAPPHVVALLALHLNRVGEAARLYKEAGRPDLLNRMYRECNNWDGALGVAGKDDRVHLRATIMAKAASVEADGDVQGALAVLRSADSDHGRLEGCRLLYEAGDWAGLREWVEECLQGAEEAAARDGSGGSGGAKAAAAAAAAGVGVGEHAEGGGAIPGEVPSSASTGSSSAHTGSSSAGSAVGAGSGRWGPSPNATGRWYAQFLEARGDASGAAAYYRRVGDAPSLVRLHISAGDVEGAAALAEAALASSTSTSSSGAGAGVGGTGAPYSGAPAAAYLLARHAESCGDVPGALKWYERCGRFNHACRLAAASGREADLLTLAARAGPATRLAVARALEGKGEAAALSRAVRLYHSGGATPRAMELCLAAGLWEELGAIAEDLGAHPEAVARIPTPLLTRVAEGFLARKAYVGAVGLLVAGGRFGEAIDMALENGVALTEALAEALTPPKPKGAEGLEVGGGAGGGDPALQAALALRSSQLLRLAGALKKQGLFHAACKKYTQAGDKVRAMKALLRSGDTEKIVFFAGAARSKEIFVLAANHLQTLQWHLDPEILKSIIDFYTKAKAYDLLSTFYEACGAVEIDEFRNYEKAAAALREASKAAGKIKEEAIKDARLMTLQGKCARQQLQPGGSTAHAPPP